MSQVLQESKLNAASEDETALRALGRISTLVADTGDIEEIRRYQPVEATTNPSLLLKAAADDAYRHLVEDALVYARKLAVPGENRAAFAVDRLMINFGREIAAIVPGYVSTEIDARLSFDTDATVEKGLRLLKLYADAGVARERILLKIASTWEGIRAARILESRGLRCNMTLLFGFAQAAACADAGVTLISPFVGRIYDWYKQQDGVEGYAPNDDPGVKSVRRIYAYYKRYRFPTIVMAASFRNTEQILALAGCDRMTIAPNLMLELDAMSGGDLKPALAESQAAQACADERHGLDEAEFRWQLNEDAMATEKLAEGIRRFAQDQQKLEAMLAAEL